MNPASPAALSKRDEAATFAKITWRLLPFLFLCYLCAYLDRINVAFAKLQMLKDLNFSDAVYGAGAGVFFVGYLLFEVPSNLLLLRVGARRWIARIMITWGIISAGMMFVTTPMSFYIMRFLLGVAEAGFIPAILFYLTYWFPASRRSKVTALFMTGIPMSGVVGGPLSGWIMSHMGGIHGLAGWQWLFVLEGIPTAMLGLIVLFYLNDKVSRRPLAQRAATRFPAARARRRTFAGSAAFGQGRPDASEDPAVEPDLFLLHDGPLRR